MCFCTTHDIFQPVGAQLFLFLRHLRMMKATTLHVSVPLPTLSWRVWNSSTPSLALKMVARVLLASYNVQQRVPKILVPSGTFSPHFATFRAGVTNSRCPKLSATLPNSSTSVRTRKSCCAASRWTQSSQPASSSRVAKPMCPARSARFATSHTCRRRCSVNATRRSSRRSTSLPVRAQRVQVPQA